MTDNKKSKRGIHFNIGMIVFLVMVIYLTGYMITYLQRDKLAIYEVTESDIKDTIEGAGIVIRDEELVISETEGYLSPYVKEGSRIQKGGTVYTVDTTGKVQEFISEIAGEKEETSNEEKKSVIEELRTFGESYSDDRFGDVYDAKNNIAHNLMAYTDTIMAQNKDEFNAKYGEGSYIEVKSESEGIVSYQSDGMESKTVDDLEVEDFNGKNDMKDLRITEKAKAGTPVYRIIKSQTWDVVMEVSKDEYLKLKEQSNKDVTEINVGFDKDDFTAKASFQCYMKDNHYYVDLTFDKYIQRYINQRYLWIELIVSEADGLIVPTSSIIIKEAYKIPLEYLMNSGSGQSDYYVNVLTTKKNGDQTLKQVKVDLIKSNTTHAYVNSTKLNKGDVISDVEKDDTLTLGDKVKVRGVYVVNQGYADYQTVELKQRTEDYCILYEKSSNIQMYDRIILHSDSIKENQLIY